jgi:hypothetical protein
MGLCASLGCHVVGFHHCSSRDALLDRGRGEVDATELVSLSLAASSLAVEAGFDQNGHGIVPALCHGAGRPADTSRKDCTYESGDLGMLLSFCAGIMDTVLYLPRYPGILPR